MILLDMDYMLPVSYVFSNPNVVSIFLVKELLAKSSRVVVVTNHRAEFAKYFSKDENLIFKDFRESVNEIPAYIFLVQGFSIRDGFFSKSILKTILKFSADYAPKTEVILPYVVNNETRRDVENVAEQAKKIKNRNLSIVYLGEIYGAGMDLFSFTWVSSLMRSLWRETSLFIPMYDMEFYLVDIKQAIETLIKGIFSYGFPGKENVIAYKKSAYEFLRELQDIIPGVNYVTDEKIIQPGTISNYDFLEVQENKNVLKETVEWVIKNRSEKEIKIKKVRKIKVNKKKLGRAGILLSLAVFVFILPFLSLLVSTTALKIGFLKLTQSDLKSATTYFDISSGFATFSTQSKTLRDMNSFGKEATNTVNLGQKLEREIAGNNDYDLAGESNQLFLNLDDLYKKSSFLSLEKSLPITLDFNNLRLYLDNTRTLVKNLPSILGMDKKMNYLVVTQDKNELRPTGGLITALDVFTFEKGKLTNKSSYDVKNSDKLLKGQVDPPDALKKYLGQNNWKLADANWDADFRIAAPKIEWFLQNEVNQLIDGVVTMSSDNIINENNIFDLLKSKDVQVFLNDDRFSTSLNNLNWDGGVDIPSCFGNCISNWLGIVEANLGGNKVNSQISRTSNLLVNLTGTDVLNRLEVNYKNAGTETYRNFVRVMAPASAIFEKASLTINSDQRNLPVDIAQLQGRTEGGVLLQVPAGTLAQVVFTWHNKNTIDYSKSGKVLFYMRRQAGIFTSPTNINFVLPAFLTQRAVTRYNTNLESDFNTKIEW